MEEQPLKLEDVAIIKTKKPQMIKRYKCPYLGCNKEFNNSADLSFHIKFDHLKLIDHPPSKKENIKNMFVKLKYLHLKMQIKAFTDFMRLYFKEKEYLGEKNGRNRKYR